MDEAQRIEAQKELWERRRELEYSRLNKQRLLVESVNPHTIFETDSLAEKGSVMSSMCFKDGDRPGGGASNGGMQGTGASTAGRSSTHRKRRDGRGAKRTDGDQLSSNAMIPVVAE